MPNNIDELTRQGKNICKCGIAKQMYYVPWCPICEKPAPEKLEYFNLIKCLRHLEVINKGIYERIWDYVIKSGEFRSNDSFINVYFDISNSDLMIFADTFGLKKGESHWFYISW